MPSNSFQTLIEEHYATLRRLAARALHDRKHVERMSPTSLVAECMIRLLKQREKPTSEAHLRGLATVFMARVLADSARARLRKRRGSGAKAKSLDDAAIEVDLSLKARQQGERTAIRSYIDRDALLAAMQDLAIERPRQMEILTLHIVAGIPLPRAANMVGISERTAYREVDEGRRALAQKLRDDHG